MNNKTPPTQPTESLALAGVAGQAGCVTLIVVIAALVLGLWLDNALNTRQVYHMPVATIVLIVLSVPVSVYLMLRTVLNGMARFHEARGHRQVNSESAVGGVWRSGEPSGRNTTGNGDGDGEDEE